jgi:hypothetical protein
MGNPAPAVKSLTAAAGPAEAPKTPPNMANKQLWGQVIDFSASGFANSSCSGLLSLGKSGEFVNPHKSVSERALPGPIYLMHKKRQPFRAALFQFTPSRCRPMRPCRSAASCASRLWLPPCAWLCCSRPCASCAQPGRRGSQP